MKKCPCRSGAGPFAGEMVGLLVFVAFVVSEDGGSGCGSDEVVRRGSGKTREYGKVWEGAKGFGEETRSLPAQHHSRYLVLVKRELKC